MLTNPRASARPTSPRIRLARALLAPAAVAALALLAPAAGQADVVTFGSTLAVPATLDTANNISPAGHDGSDNAMWDLAQATGTLQAPAPGQITQVRLEGCAKPASGGPAPLTQIHFQTMEHQSDGTWKAQLTSGAFDIPICGQNGASGATITPYQPVNFCVRQGGYIDFNDEGGFDANYYPNGVPYMVIGSIPGSTMASFIRGGGTNGPISPSDTTSHDGYAANQNEELMLQATEATGSDLQAPDMLPCRNYLGVPTTSNPSNPSNPSTKPSGPTPSSGPGVHVSQQNDGINRKSITRVAFFCAQKSGCTGAVGVYYKKLLLARGSFSVPGSKTAKVSLKLSSKTVALIRKHHRRLQVTEVVVLAGQSPVTHAITLYV